MRSVRALSILTLASVSALVGAVSPASADDWKITAVRGLAFALREGAWTPLRLGDVVSDASPIHTYHDGTAQLSRDNETVDMGPDSEISILDRAGERFTTIREPAGRVTVHANIENVKHFSVQTPFISAVVKGTIFTVIADQQRSEVSVTRGLVGVEDNLRGTHVDVAAGQSAIAGFAGQLQIVGPKTGQQRAAVPLVRSANISSTEQVPKPKIGPNTHTSPTRKIRPAPIEGAGGAAATPTAGTSVPSPTNAEIVAGSSSAPGGGAISPGGGSGTTTNAIAVEHDPGFWVRLR